MSSYLSSLMKIFEIGFIIILENIDLITNVT